MVTRSQKRQRQSHKIPLAVEVAGENLTETEDPDIIIPVWTSDSDDDLVEYDSPINRHHRSYKPPAHNLGAMDPDEEEWLSAGIFDNPQQLEAYVGPEELEMVDEEEEDYTHLTDLPVPAIRTPDSLALPTWGPSSISYKQRIKRLPIPVRIEGEHLNEFANLMIALPMEQFKDSALQPIIQHLLGKNTPLPRPLDRIIHRYTLEPITKALTFIRKNFQQRFVLPTSLQQAAVSLFHKAPGIGSHSGPQVTLCHLQRFFYWKGMEEYVTSYCASCITCIAGKPPTGKLPGYLTPPPIPRGPLFRLSADTIRGLPISNRLQYVLVVQCAYTKMVFARALLSLKPISVINELVEIFTRFGPPQIFTADRGGEFFNGALLEFLKVWGVTPIYSESYNPQANGQAESAVKITTRRLRTALYQVMYQSSVKSGTIKAWPKYLPYVIMSYNTSPHPVLGLSPYEAMFGRTFPCPIPDPRGVRYESTVESLSDHLLTIQAALASAHDLISLKLKHRRDNIKKMFDKFRQPLRVAEGDYAYIYYPKTFKLPKLSPRAYGPFPVLGVDRLLHTQEVLGVTVNLGTEDKPIPKRFARSRIHPLSYAHRDINWEELEKRASELREGTQQFLYEGIGALDDTTLTRGAGRRLCIPGILTPEDNEEQRGELLSIVQDHPNYHLYE